MTLHTQQESEVFSRGHVC